MRALKNIVLSILIQFRIYPNLFFISNPLKIYEFKELTKNIGISKKDKVLDLGCGAGLQTLILGKKCKEITGVEISESAVASARRKSEKLRNRINSRFLCSKLEDAKLEDESFDKVFSICVIEHISNYEEVLKEIHRILKKQGQIVFSVDCLETITDSDLIEKHKKDHFVVKYFGIEELKTLLENTGFNKVDIYPIFKGPLARKLFVEGIKNQFRYGFISSIMSYLALRKDEERCADLDKGIFLVAKCTK
ncbi:class I SAM-dependent methyltransferase [bacterium]|nr:class I SAM-dependent methyltransferase [bacterium]MBU1652651.1 class I SAM-dependent methyltransferase [bacterium]MBU1882460.1 class I SAM-dependent methyltransferase [bacterium]